ncbi:CRISPR system precrRNA processing endoribonuclease RAMP protein Cas6 [Chloroflexota bacterium]
MPTTLTIPFTTTERLFFDETWPLERLFLDILTAGRPASLKNERLKPYTLSPIWLYRQRGVPAEEKQGHLVYQWRVSLLDDSLTGLFLDGLKATPTLKLNSHLLAIGPVKTQTQSYAQLAKTSQGSTRPPSERYFNFEFMTPVILRRHGLPFPLPDPIAIFHHYLLAWDTFAPRKLWININVLDAIEAHLALVEHQLETRQVRPDGKAPKTGFLGQATYKMMAWEKLGSEFLETLHRLAHFAEFCGTGDLTECGLGQTRYKHHRKTKRP